MVNSDVTRGEPYVFAISHGKLLQLVLALAGYTRSGGPAKLGQQNTTTVNYNKRV